MSDKKIYIGSGKQVPNYEMVNCSICLSDIKEHVYEYNGKKYLNITVAKKKEPDQYGKTHSVSINEYKPEKQEPKSEPKQDIKPDLEPQPDDLPF